MISWQKLRHKENNESLEQTLWKTADKSVKIWMQPSTNDIVLGLIFLKYISDVFEDLYQKLIKGEENTKADLKTLTNTGRKMYSTPAPAGDTSGPAKLPTIGKDTDNAMEAIERDNPSLKGVLPTR